MLSRAFHGEQESASRPGGGIYLSILSYLFEFLASNALCPQSQNCITVGYVFRNQRLEFGFICAECCWTLCRQSVSRARRFRKSPLTPRISTTLFVGCEYRLLSLAWACQISAHKDHQHRGVPEVQVSTVTQEMGRIGSRRGGREELRTPGRRQDIDGEGEEDGPHCQQAQSGRWSGDQVQGYDCPEGGEDPP